MTTSTPRAIGHYTAEQVARLAGVSARRIGAWARLGIVPSVSADPRIYSYADAGEAVLVHYLVASKVETKAIRGVVERLRDRYGPWPLTNAPLENDGALVVTREGDLHFNAATDEQVMSVTLLNLRRVRDALRQGGWVSMTKDRPLISVNPGRHSGAPTIAGRRLPTRLVATIAEEPDGGETLREGYGLTNEQIQAAVDYERDVEAALAA